LPRFGALVSISGADTNHLPEQVRKPRSPIERQVLKKHLLPEMNTYIHRQTLGVYTGLKEIIDMRKSNMTLFKSFESLLRNMPRRIVFFINRGKTGAVTGQDAEALSLLFARESPVCVFKDQVSIYNGFESFPILRTLLNFDRPRTGVKMQQEVQREKEKWTNYLAQHHWQL
jgi:hypothetical protein